MSLKQKSIRLLIVLALLVIANLGFFFYEGRSSNLSFDQDQFTIADTTAIQRISIINRLGEVTMDRASGFRVNDRYAVDPTMMQVFTAVFNRIAVSRKLGATSSSSVREWLEQEGADVTIDLDDDQLTFRAVGDPNRTRTFFESDGEIYEVEIPGYRDYLGNLFQLDEDQWRNRVIVNSNWRTIQRLTVEYLDTNREPLEISFEDSFFIIPGLSELDSNAVVAYLDEFQFLQGNERISSGKYARFDSLSQTSPIAVIEIDDINSRETLSIAVFQPVDDEDYQLVLDPNEEMILFDSRRIMPLLKNKSDFIYQVP